MVLLKNKVSYSKCCLPISRCIELCNTSLTALSNLQNELAFCVRSFLMAGTPIGFPLKLLLKQLLLFPLLGNLTVFSLTRDTAFKTCTGLSNEGVLNSPVIPSKYRWIIKQVSMNYQATINVLSSKYQWIIKQVSMNYQANIDEL